MIPKAQLGSMCQFWTLSILPYVQSQLMGRINGKVSIRVIAMIQSIGSSEISEDNQYNISQ
jgi:hypothetical protein